MIAGAMAELSMSLSDCVAKMTLAFFFRRVLSHSLSWSANPSSSSASQPLVDNQQGRSAIEPVADTVEQVGQNRRCGLGADQALDLICLHI